ncbi:ABC-type cobalamin/Fe3+-siderophores transport system component [Geoglobus ahangari]|uniref:ABC-type cobalamin/Fe3+-siderophores transport system component n=1 Tax=Geoglobus ahangari TaxID=113653 RepID=A0A0F7IFG1_9EURY|nr:ABC transporter ATP-binding protein [Geoglobus ahangari]AKG91554.1 ABC-type cobalamin/Fe3+-siderophores transport system component [Geoglobus ahangari]
MALEVRDVGVVLGSRRVLESVALSLRKRELVVLLGPNGSGKSTLMKAIYGILRPVRGAIYVDGRAVHSMDRKEVARHLGYLPQESESASLRVIDVVLFGRIPHVQFSPSSKDYEKAIHALRMVGMEGYAQRNFSELSGGEKQKVLLARIFCQETDYLLLDEPTSHLDIRSQVEVMRVVRKLVDSGKGALVAMHDVNLAAMFADRVVMVKNGRIVVQGGVREVITPENIMEVYGIDVEVVRYNGSVVVVPKVQ